MKRWRLFLFTTVIIGLLVVPAPSFGQDGTDRPFRAALTGTAHWEFPGATPSGCTVVTTITEATGEATHLGRVSASWSHCPAEAEYVIDGRLTITAANGDKLTARYDYDPNNTLPAFPITWTGGTGRFANASGSIAAVFQVTPVFLPGCTPDPDPFPCFDFSVPWAWSATLAGTISY